MQDVRRFAQCSWQQHSRKVEDILMIEVWLRKLLNSMATTLAKAIKFKKLIKQLSKHEFLQFMAQVYDRDQSDFMSSLVFNHFVRTSSIVNPNADDLNSIYQFHIINNYSITKTKTKRSSNERCQIKHTPHSSHWPVCFVSAPKLIIQTIEKWLLLLEMWINEI